MCLIVVVDDDKFSRDCILRMVFFLNYKAIAFEEWSRSFRTLSNLVEQCFSCHS
jgi:FixJ family two-component response regulator